MIPKLRFPEFNGEWRSYQLGDIASFQRGKGISKADIEAEGSYQCIRYGELYTEYSEVIDRVLSKTNQPLTESVVSKRGDVLIPASGETAIDMATACSLQFDDIILGGDINVIRPLKKTYSELIAFSLSHSNRTQLARVAQGNTVVHIYGKHLSKLQIELPSIEEEIHAINKILKAVNKKIHLLTKKKEALATYKKGLMQKIFSQELRFKREDGTNYPEWKKVKLSDEYEYLNAKAHEQLVVSNGSYKLINSKFVSTEGRIYKTVDEVLTEARIGDITMVLSDLPNGKALAKAFYIDKNHTYAINQRVCRLRALNTAENDSRFLYYLISRNRYFLKLDNGVGQTHISKSDVLDFQFFKPLLDEQAVIADTLNSLDKNINIITEKLSRIKQFKKGLLQQMFI